MTTKKTAFFLCAFFSWAALTPAVNAAVKFGRDQLKGTTRTMNFTADQRSGLQVEVRGRNDYSGKFSLEIDGVAIAGITRVDGIQHDSEVIEYQDGEDQSKRPGNHKPGVVVITKDWSNTKEFYNWRQSVINGKVDRKSVSVVFVNDAGAESMRINLFDCYPTKWTGPDLNAKNSGHATESIEVLFERMEMK